MSFKLEHGRYLYHYTSAATAADHIVPTMKIRMSPMADVNDPRESKIWLPTLGYGSTGLPDGMDFSDYLSAFNDVMRERTKVVCFTRDDPTVVADSPPDLYGWGYAHSRMWDRYADNHRAVCLVFEIDTLGDEICESIATRGQLLNFGVAYHNYPPGGSAAFHMSTDDIDAYGLQGALVDHRDRHHGVLYFYKAADWASENEWRWILFSAFDDRWEYASVNQSLAGVIFGVDCRGADMRRMRWLLRSRPGMRYAQMTYRNGHPIPLTLP